jgi:hypothetical protein
LGSFIKFGYQYFLFEIIKLYDNGSGEPLFGIVNFPIDQIQEPRLKIELADQQMFKMK